METFRLHLQRRGLWYFLGLLWCLWVALGASTPIFTLGEAITGVSVIFAASGIILWGFALLCEWIQKDPRWDEGEEK